MNNRQSKRIDWGASQERFIGISLILAFVLPHTNIMLMIINPLLAILLFRTNSGKFNKVGIVPILAVLVSFFFGLWEDAGTKSIMTASITVMYLLLFPEIKYFSIKNIYIYIIFSILFLSQMAYVFHIQPITSIIDTLYPLNNWDAGEHLVNSMRENANIYNLSDFRNGGLYRNPNQYAKFVTFLQGIFLALNSKKGFVSKLPFIVLCIFSILLTGSRTGFIITFLLAFASFYQDNRKKNLTKIIALLMIIGVILWFFINASSIGFRGAAIGEGLEDSAGAKLLVLLDYLQSESNLLSLLIGHLDFTLYNSGTLYGFDSEYGYIIYCYGFLGLLAFVYFYYTLLKNTDKKCRLFYIVLLWAVSSSIFMAYRAAFIFVLLASALYKRKNTIIINGKYNI